MDKMTHGKNLLDIEKTIQNEISYIENHNETVTSIEMNKYTQDYLKSKNIYGFKSYITGNIPIIINNLLINLELKINREKNSKSTEYEPYKIEEVNINMDIEDIIERIKRQITIGECEKNIGIPVYISDLKAVLSELEKKDKVINEMAKEIFDCNEYIDNEFERKLNFKTKEQVIEKFTDEVEKEGK